MKVKGIKEIIDIQKITVHPGKASEIIKRIETGTVIAFAVSGHGMIRNVKEELGHLLSYNTAQRFDYRMGDEFIIEVAERFEEPLSVVLMQVVMTKDLI